MRFACVLLTAIFMAVQVGSARAQQPASTQPGCTNKSDSAATIAACDALIKTLPKGSAQLIDALFYRAMAHVALGHNDKALADVDEALAHQPNDAQLHDTRAIINYAAGNLEIAIADATRSVELEPNQVDAYFWRGKAWRKKGDLNRAIQDFTEAIRRKPDERSLEARGNSYVDLRQPEKGIADLTEAIKLNPKAPSLLSNRGLAHAVAGDVTSAIADFRAALALEPGHPGALKGLQSLQPTPSPAQLAIAQDLRTCTGISAWQERRSACDRLINESGALPGTRALAFGERGGNFIDADKLDEALSDLSKAVELLPDIAHVHANLGVALNRKGQNREALAALDRAIALDPKLGHAHYNRGIVHLALKDLQKAIADFGRSIELDPNDVKSWANRGAAKLKLDEVASALVDLDRAVHLAPTFFSLTMRCQAHARLNNKGAAIADCSKAIAMEPNNHEGFGARGVAWQRLGDQVQALVDFKRALELAPHLAISHSNLATALSKTGKFLDAINAYSRAIAFEPRFADHYYARGACYTVLNKYDLALADLAKAIELDPTRYEPYANRASIYLARKQYRDVIAEATKAIERNGAISITYQLRAAAFEKIGDKKRAIADLRDAYLFNPNSPAIKAALRDRGVLVSP